jgi:hypothetical protein
MSALDKVLNTNLKNMDMLGNYASLPIYADLITTINNMKMWDLKAPKTYSQIIHKIYE